MASEKTPNLGLNQIDRTSPKTTYFDLEKYLDQNWRAVDDFAGDVNDGVNEIKKRLDTTERKAVTLEPGVRIVHAEKASPFSLTGLNGRTLVNLLGRMGNCETVSEWSSNVAIAIDSNNKTNGSSSFKITLGSVPATASASFLTTPGRKYIAIADVKSGNTSKVAISINGIAGAVGNEVTSGSVFAPSVVRFTAKEYFHIVTITGTGATGNTFNMDSVRVYEISDADYAAAASLTPAQAAAQYPYVDSVMPVRNPFAIRYGENLLPSFYEWALHANAVVLGPNKLQLKATTGNQASSVVVLCVPGKSFKISGTIPLGTYVRVSFYDANGTFISDLFNTSITTPNNCYRMGIELQNNNAEGATGTFVFENIMLNIGSTSKPFKPREDSMLALQTDLYADPVTGDNADTVYERDGQYFKSKRWQGLTLDGSRAWVQGEGGAANGNRQVKVSGLAAGAVAGSGIGTKFDGKILPQGSTGSTPDSNAVTAAGEIYLGIPLADSGWADSYGPTVDDIKAYFYGYKAYDANTITPANAQAMTTATWTGTGTKYWVQRVGAPNFTQTVPQQLYAGYTPYQLVYQLATPTVEPIVSEGQLSFVEGDNQVEVGTGIVLREPSTPLPYPNEAGRWMINYIGLAGYTNPLKNLPSKILKVYGSGFSEPFRWGNTAVDGGWYGNVYIDYLYAYAANKAYTVTYLMLDKSPVVPFTGSYAANEKTLLADLVDSVQQNTARVSVLENKKADKDNLAWIVPTLLNGWVNTGQGRASAAYRKDSSGNVQIRGGVKSGVVTSSPMFILPDGYRPRANFKQTVVSWTGTSIVAASVLIYTDGRVVLSEGNNNEIELGNIQFSTD